MVLQTRDIAKTDIDLSGAILFRVLQNFNWCHLPSALKLLQKTQFIVPEFILPRGVTDDASLIVGVELFADGGRAGL
jgi:hypothetical protein